MAPISESPPNVSFPLPSCLPHSWSSSVLAVGAERVELKVSGALFPVQVIQVRLLEFFQTKAKRAHWESNTSRSSSICSVLSGAGRKTGDIKGLGLEKKRNSLSWNLSFYFLLAENQDKYLLCNITDKVQVPYQDGACFPKATLPESLGTKRGPWECQQAGHGHPFSTGQPARHIIVKSRGKNVYSAMPH